MEVELNEAQPIPEIPAPSSRFREFQKADARYVKVEQLGGWIFFGILCVVELVLLVVLYLTLGFGIIYAILCVATLGLLLFLGWALQAYPAAAHQYYCWKLDERGLQIHKGIWFRSEISVPLHRVQHTDVEEGPLLRRYGLAKLVVHTAGTQEASVELEGLEATLARELRDLLIMDKEF